MKKIWMVALVIFCLVLCSCQKTPDKPIVENKNDDDLWKIISEESTISENNEFPGIWKDRIIDQNKRLTVDIDSTINVPDKTEFPVSRVRKIDITEEWVEKLILNLNSGGKIYSFQNETFYTKSDVERIILDLKRTIMEYELDSQNDYTQAIEELNNEIEAWERYYSKAPEQFTVKEIPVQFKETNTGILSFECGLSMGKPRMAQFTARKVNEGGYITYSNFGDDDSWPIATTLDMSNMNGTLLSIDDAKDLGEDFIKEKLCLDNYELSFALAGYMEPSADSQIANIEDCKKSYIFYYTQSVENIPTTWRDDDKDMFLRNERMIEKIESNPSYGPFYPQESIRLIITDNGVINMEWDMPAEQTDLLNKNVKLLPFEDIKEIVKKQFLIEGIWPESENEAIIERKITITRIELGMMQIKEKDSYHGLLMVPTWNLYGYETYTYDAPQEGMVLDENNQMVNDQMPGHSFLTINALDGSIINPILGY